MKKKNPTPVVQQETTKNPFEGLSDADLRAELNQRELEIRRREKVAEYLEWTRRDARAKLYTKVITRELVDILVPTHEYHDCGDLDTDHDSVNGCGEPCCTRCWLLSQLATYGFFEADTEIRLSVKVTRDPRETKNGSKGF